MEIDSRKLDDALENEIWREIAWRDKCLFQRGVELEKELTEKGKADLFYSYLIRDARERLLEEEKKKSAENVLFYSYLIKDAQKKLLDRNWIKSLFYELAENHQKSPYEVIVCRGGEEAEDFEHFLRMGLVGKTAAGSTLEERVPPIITLPKGTEEDLRIYGRRTYFLK